MTKNLFTLPLNGWISVNIKLQMFVVFSKVSSVFFYFFLVFKVKRGIFFTSKLIRQYKGFGFFKVICIVGIGSNMFWSCLSEHIIYWYVLLGAFRIEFGLTSSWVKKLNELLVVRNSIHIEFSSFYLKKL